MSVEVIGSAAAITMGIEAAIFGFQSGWESGEKHEEKMKQELDHEDKMEQELETSKKITFQRYAILRLLLSIPVGWGFLSFIFSLNGLTIIQPYMVNSTTLWNWGIFLLVNLIVGMLIWVTAERIYLRI